MTQPVRPKRVVFIAVSQLVVGGAFLLGWVALILVFINAVAQEESLAALGLGLLLVVVVVYGGVAALFVGPAVPAALHLLRGSRRAWKWSLAAQSVWAIVPVFFLATGSFLAAGPVAFSATVIGLLLSSPTREYCASPPA